MPVDRLADEKGKLRVMLQKYGWPELVESAYAPIRRYGFKDARLVANVLRGLTQLKRKAPPDRHDPLTAQADAIRDAALAADLHSPDLEQVEENHAAFIEAHVLRDWPA